MDRGLQSSFLWCGNLLLGVSLLTACDGDSPSNADASGDGGGINTLGGDTDTEGDTEGNTSGVSGTQGDADTTPETDSSADDTGEDPGPTTSADTGGDTEPDNVDTGNEAQILFLEVDPPETILELDLNMAASQDFTVNAVYTDGSVIDVTDQATWEISNPAVGAIAADGTLSIPAFADNFFESAVLTADVDGDTGKAQITVAAYDLANDFFFVLPFEDEAGNQDKPLTFETGVKSLDVFINMDTTGSMGGALSNLQSSLANTIIPEIQTEVPDTQFGVGTFEDFPLEGYGDFGSGDQPFELFAAISNNIANVQAAVLGLELGYGVDGPESNIEAMYQIATGEGLPGPAPTSVPANNAGIGGVGFREGSFPVVVSITDAVSHDTASNACTSEQYGGTVAPVAHSQAQAMTALNAICGRVIQIAVGTSTGSCSAYEDGVQFNEATGAVVPPEAWDIGGRPPGCAAGQCCTGSAGAGRAPNAAGQCPMTYTASSNGTGVDSSFSDAVSLLAAYGQFDVTSEVTGGMADEDGGALPAGTSTADFIKSVTPFSHGVVPLPGVADPVLTPTTFEGVIPDTDVTFTVEAFNDFVDQGPQPRLFSANISVLADDCGDLDDRDVFILVPPAALPPPG